MDNHELWEHTFLFSGTEAIFPASVRFRMKSFAHAAGSVLLITLDSCRYDTFAATELPHLKAVGPLHRAFAPSHFTFGSHAAMFVGFTPGLASGAPVPYANPKFGRIFKMHALSHPGFAPPLFTLEGRNIVDGFRRRGLLTLGTGAMGWFNPALPTTATLLDGFERFHFQGEDPADLRAQLAWLGSQLAAADRPVFLFLNVGETHVPYHHQEASWDRAFNPCQPFDRAGTNDAGECRRRQSECLRFVDAELAPLLAAFSDATVVLCGDHGDCWGEDGLWEHGIAHEKVFEVPLVLRLPTAK